MPSLDLSFNSELTFWGKKPALLQSIAVTMLRSNFLFFIVFHAFRWKFCLVLYKNKNCNLRFYCSDDTILMNFQSQPVYFIMPALRKQSPPLKILLYMILSLLKVKLELQLRCAVVSSLFYDIFFTNWDLC